jgi:hypothetical protein
MSTCLFLYLFLASRAVSGLFHEVGAIHLSAKTVATGGSVTVRGEKLPKASDLKLELRGVLDNFPVGSVKTDTAGAFQMSLTVPSTVPAGTYTLVVIASDGDVTARADLAVSAALVAPANQPGGGSMSSMPGMADHDMAGMTNEQASAAPMQIPHTTTPAEAIVIWGVIGASLVWGLTLIRKARTA